MRATRGADCAAHPTRADSWPRRKWRRAGRAHFRPVHTPRPRHELHRPLRTCRARVPKLAEFRFDEVHRREHTPRNAEAAFRVAVIADERCRRSGASHLDLDRAQRRRQPVKLALCCEQVDADAPERSGKAGRHGIGEFRVAREQPVEPLLVEGTQHDGLGRRCGLRRPGGDFRLKVVCRRTERLAELRGTVGKRRVRGWGRRDCKEETCEEDAESHLDRTACPSNRKPPEAGGFR